MLALFALTLLSVATAVSVLAYQRSTHRQLGPRPGDDDEQRQLPPMRSDAPRTLSNLMIGDVVLDGEEDFYVSGMVAYREEDDEWFRYLLDDGVNQRHLLLLPGERRSGALMSVADDLPTFGQLMNGLTLRGQSYTIVRRGDAVTLASGAASRVGQSVQYALYRGAGGLMLYVEEYDGERHGYLGPRTDSTTLTLMQGEARDEDFERPA